MKKEEALGKLLNFQQTIGGKMKEWYAGITADIPRRLFVEHEVDPEIKTFEWAMMDSADEARAVEKFFIEKAGMTGGPGGADEKAIWVYIYKKTRSTKQ